MTDLGSITGVLYVINEKEKYMKDVPARLTLQDLPRDKSRALGGLRQALCASVNYCRRYPDKLELLKQTLKTAYNYVNAYQKAVAAKDETIAKNKLEAEGKQLGIDLDKRKTVEGMKADLDEFVAKSEEEKAAITADMEKRAAEAEKKAKIEAAQATIAEAQKVVKELSAASGTK